MQNEIDPAERARHLRLTEPSPWVSRFAPLVPGGAEVLDVASGGGRNARVFINRGHRVTAIDKNTSALAQLAEQEMLEVIEYDMETGAPVFDGEGPLSGRKFGAVIVINYLYRPHFEGLINAIMPGGLLIYETFALGNEDYAKPRNPDHLLRSGELLDLVSKRMQVVAYEHGLVKNGDIPGVKQRLCAVMDLALSQRPDGQPPAHPI